MAAAAAADVTGTSAVERGISLSAPLLLLPPLLRVFALRLLGPRVPMLFRFGAILPARLAEGGTVLCVSGSRPELGEWDPKRALVMKPSRPLAPLPAQEPVLWLGEVALPGEEEAASTFWYKFLRRLETGDAVWEGKNKPRALPGDASAPQPQFVG